MSVSQSCSSLSLANKNWPGTPPNLILVGFLTAQFPEHSLNFGSWMAFALPEVLTWDIKLSFCKNCRCCSLKLPFHKFSRCWWTLQSSGSFSRYISQGGEALLTFGGSELLLLLFFGFLESCLACSLSAIIKWFEYISKDSIDLKVRRKKWSGKPSKGADQSKVRKSFDDLLADIIQKVRSPRPTVLSWNLCSRCLLSSCAPLVLQVHNSLFSFSKSQLNNHVRSCSHFDQPSKMSSFLTNQRKPGFIPGWASALQWVGWE